MKKLFIVSILLPFSMNHADIPFEQWTKLNYGTPTDCFQTGMKRVFVPYPGFGTFACAKDAASLLPDGKKSVSLLAGHTIGLIAASAATITLLVVAAHLDIPHAKEILGPHFIRWFVKAPRIDTCRDD